MNERQAAFFKELLALCRKHKAEIDKETRGHDWNTEDVTVVHFNGTEKSEWDFETVDLLGGLWNAEKAERAEKI